VTDLRRTPPGVKGVGAVRRYQAFAEIRTFTGDAPEGGDAYDARDVITSLKPKIVLPLSLIHISEPTRPY